MITLYPQYKNRKELRRILKNFINEFIKFYEKSNHNIFEAIEEFEGLNTIPIMTLHKSKGLEFKVVIFIGLEDSALWNYSKNRKEEINGFFVAFSRAKEKIIFSYSENRAGKVQSYTTINELYEILKKANVPFSRYSNKNLVELQNTYFTYK